MANADPAVQDRERAHRRDDLPSVPAGPCWRVPPARPLSRSVSHSPNKAGHDGDGRDRAAAAWRKGDRVGLEYAIVAVTCSCCGCVGFQAATSYSDVRPRLAGVDPGDL